MRPRGLDRPRRAWVDRHLGSLIGIGLCVLPTLAAQLLPVASVAALALPAVALVAAVMLLHRREGTAYLELVVWLWLLTPWARRLIDDASSFSEQSPVLLAAPLASLPGLVPALFRRSPLHREASAVFLVALVACGYAFAAGVIRFGPAPALIGLLPWLAPLAVGLHVATAPMKQHELDAAVTRLVTIGSLVLGAYGLYQFFALPDWDANWMANVELNSIGRPFPLEVRVFSTLNAPAPFAMTLGAFLVIAATARSHLWLPVSVVGFVGLGLSLVRTAWIGLAVALLLLLVSGHGRAVRAALVIIVLPALLLLTVQGPAREAVTERFDTTVEAGDQDNSLSDRVVTYGERLPQVLRDPSGVGFGGLGAAARQAEEDEDVTVGLDSGVLEALLSMGAVVGSALLLAIVVAAIGLWSRARTAGALGVGAGAALLALVAQLLLANSLISAQGVAFWVLFGYLARPRLSAPSATDESRRVQAVTSP